MVIKQYKSFGYSNIKEYDHLLCTGDQENKQNIQGAMQGSTYKYKLYQCTNI